MNLTRIVTGVLGFPLVAIVLIFGNEIVIDVAFAIIAAMSLHEYFNAMKAKYKPVIWLGYILSAMIAFIHIIPHEYFLRILGMVIPASVLILFLQVILSNMKTNIADIAITAFGICYIPLFLLFMPIIMAQPDGKLLIWYVIFAAWGTDVFAYTVGKLMGKHKFNGISPNKTIEGCIGGIIGATVISLAYTFFLNTYLSTEISYIVIGVISALLSIIGQIGDFSASSIKRFVGIKDFSNLIPGHGGLLDRIDSVIFIAPFAYFLLMLM